ncbi:MAG: PA2169 family four-helix-bundle protein [Bacteroidota bacterium]|nr:PA2169 family four-helix-bundle protein [Bacteroidota bacterium]
METIEKSVEVLNDLIEINNDRVAGFEHASKDLGDGDNDLKDFFRIQREASRQNSFELTKAVNQLGGEAEDGKSVSGTIHRNWLDVRATFTGHDRKSILDECERGEDAIKKAYKDALNSDNGLSEAIRQIVQKQQQGIMASHDTVKAMRNAQS